MNVPAASVCLRLALLVFFDFPALAVECKAALLLGFAFGLQDDSGNLA